MSTEDKLVYGMLIATVVGGIILVRTKKASVHEEDENVMRQACMIEAKKHGVPDDVLEGEIEKCVSALKEADEKQA